MKGPADERVPGVRLQKLLAEAGVSSRREAIRLIQAGRVTVNGQTVTEPGLRAHPGQDRIGVDGRDLPGRAPNRYVLLHKPPGYLTTRRDPQGRRRVFDLVPEMGVRLHPVGRLDYDTEGLLLLTNDGALTYVLTHPRYEIPRTYHVCVEGPADASTLSKLRRGALLEDGLARAEEVRRLPDTEEGAWLALTLREGRYREVRRLCRAVGLRVRRLIRVAFGPLELGRLAPGAWRELEPLEVTTLRQLGEGRRRPSVSP